MYYAGIDVGSEEVVVAVKDKKRLLKTKPFSNDASGHKALIKYLTYQKSGTRVCVEATGSYHFDLSVRLSDSKNIEVMVLNPRQSKHYAEVLNHAHKTDKIDAAILADYCHRMEFRSWKRPNNSKLILRAYSRRLVAMVHQKAQLNNQLHALQASDFTPEEIINNVLTMIQFYEKEINGIETAAIEHIKKNDDLNKHFELLNSVKGIGNRSAVILLGELSVLPEDMNMKEWVSYAGLNPRIVQSGKSVLKQTKISKAGNKYLRMGLYMPALSATRSDPYVRGYYLHLIEDNGLKKMQALCAVMRKLLHAIHRMMGNTELFDSQRFYSKPVELPSRKKQQLAM
jgi:transposase